MCVSTAFEANLGPGHYPGNLYFMDPPLPPVGHPLGQKSQLLRPGFWPFFYVLASVCLLYIFAVADQKITVLIDSMERNAGIVSSSLTFSNSFTLCYSAIVTISNI